MKQDLDLSPSLILRPPRPLLPPLRWTLRYRRLVYLLCICCCCSYYPLLFPGHHESSLRDCAQATAFLINHHHHHHRQQLQQQQQLQLQQPQHYLPWLFFPSQQQQQWRSFLATTRTYSYSNSSTTTHKNTDANYAVDLKNLTNDSNNKVKNLYHVLGARGNESRAELKQLYIALAKQLHPDATASHAASRRRPHDSAPPTLSSSTATATATPTTTIGTTNSTSTTTSTFTTASSTTTGSSAVDFADIAAAWRVLSDVKLRKRYDRTLQAQAFSNQVVDWAVSVSKQAGPVLERYAIPLLRRTTTTTLASVQAAWTTTTKTTDEVNSVSEALSESSSSSSSRPSKTREAAVDRSLSQRWAAAMAAAKRAGQYVDSVELREQSLELDARVAHEAHAKESLVRDLQRHIQVRLQLSLATPQSGLTASDANQVLTAINDKKQAAHGPVDPPPPQSSSGLNKVWMHLLHHAKSTSTTIDEDIALLAKAEESYEESTLEDAAVQADYQYHLQQQSTLQARLDAAMQQQLACESALAQAQDHVRNASAALEAVSYTVKQAEHYLKKSAFNVERTLQSMQMRSEKMRQTLWQRHKEEHNAADDDDTEENNDLQHKPSVVVDKDDSEEVELKNLEQLQEMKRQEQRMLETIRLLDANFENLQSQSQKLRERADELDTKKSNAPVLSSIPSSSSSSSSPLPNKDAMFTTTLSSAAAELTSITTTATKRITTTMITPNVPLSLATKLTAAKGFAPTKAQKKVNKR